MSYTPPLSSASALQVYLGNASSPVGWTLLDGHALSNPYYVTMGSKRFESSLTTRPTFDFSVYCANATLSPLSGVPVVGTPVLLTHTTFGDIFGGQMEQTAISDIPGTSGVITDVQCVSWEMVLSRRNLALAGAIPAGSVTDTFNGGGPWATSHAYLLYQQVWTTLGHLYKCTSPGTSASSGLGPVGTGTGIADGTAIWAYVASALDGTTEWQSGHAYVQGGPSGPPNQVFNDTTGEIYTCIQSGTSGGSPPTGTGIITDGTVKWAFNQKVATTVFTLSQYPSQVLSVKVNGVSQTFGPPGGSTAWFWSVGSPYLTQNGGTPLGTSDVLVVNYNSTTGGTSVSAPTYSNMTADAIVTALMAFVSAEGFTVEIDAAGPLVDNISFTIEDSFTDALDALCTYVSNGTYNFAYYISPRKILHFYQSGVTNAAPFGIDTGTALISCVNTITREKYANAAIVNIPLALAGAPWYAVFFGDGSTQSFVLNYPVGGQAPAVTLFAGAKSAFIALGIVQNGGAQLVPNFPAGGVAQTVGLSGTTGSQWYYTQGGTSITQDTGGTALGSTDVLVVQYTAALAIESIYVSPTAVAARQAIEGGTGEHDVYVDLSGTLPSLAGTGAQIAQNLVENYSTLAQTVVFRTYKGGITYVPSPVSGGVLATGQSITLTLPVVQAVGSFVIDQVVLTDQDDQSLWEITCDTGAVIGDWKTAFKNLTSGGSTAASSVGNGGTSTGAMVTETPSGLINGSNVTFTLAVVPGTVVMLFLNGILQKPGLDFTISGATITMTKAPQGFGGIYGADWLTCSHN